MRFAAGRMRLRDGPCVKELRVAVARLFAYRNFARSVIDQSASYCSRLSNGSLTAYTEKDGLSGSFVRTIYEDGDGTLWIGTYDGGLNRLKDGRFTRYTTSEGLFSNGVFQILEDDPGNLWMSCNRGIFRVSRSQLDRFADGKIKEVDSIS